MDDRSRISRRAFLKQTSAAGMMTAFPTIIPASALGRTNRPSAGNRIVMGCIGVGSQGTGNMRTFLEKDEIQIVAVCDVDRDHLERAKQIVDTTYGNSDCRT
ncbi:MAG: hypothetical protein AMS20_16625, partial [Gemmatimonas sp. SG8_28]